MEWHWIRGSSSGAIVRAMRKRWLLSEAGLALLVGSDPNYISNWEAGEHVASERIVRAAARVLKLNERDLLDARNVEKARELQQRLHDRSSEIKEARIREKRKLQEGRDTSDTESKERLKGH